MKRHERISTPTAAALAALLAAVLVAALAVAGCGGAPRATAEHGEAAGHADEHAEAAGHADEHGDEQAEEGVVVLDAQAAANAELRVGLAGPAAIATLLEAPGEVHLDAERVLEVRPRFAGVVRELRKRVGDAVRAGEVVAVVQSNESLTDYEVTSAMAGTVLARPVVVGSAVGTETSLMTLADLGTVWVDFAIYPKWVGRVVPGAAVTIEAQNRSELRARGVVRYVGPLLEQDTRISSARVVLANPRGEWTPGLFVTAHIEIARQRVAVAVPDEALVRGPAGPAVFTVHGTRYELRPVTTGVSDGRTTQVVAGLAAGDSVVVANAFVLKSELGKNEAGHDH